MARDDRNEFAPEYVALLATDDVDLLEFLVTLAVGRRNGPLVEAVLREAAWETDPARATAMKSGLRVAAGEARVDEVLQRLHGITEGAGKKV